jgi:hypothetical protein
LLFLLPESALAADRPEIDAERVTMPYLSEYRNRREELERKVKSPIAA